METRLVLALTLSLAILVGFQLLMPKPPPPAPDAQVALNRAIDPAAPASPGLTAPAATAAVPGVAEPTEPGPTVEVRTDLYRAVFASRGGRLQHFELAKYPATAEHGSGPYDLVHANGSAPLSLLWMDAGGGVVDDRGILYDITSTATEVPAGQMATVTMVGKTATGATVTKTIELRGGTYMLDYAVTSQGLGQTPLGVAWSRQVEKHSSKADNEGPAGYVDGKLHFFTAVGLTEPTVLEGKVSWAGYAEHYFLAAYVPDQPVASKLVASAGDGAGHSALWTTGPADKAHYQIFLGPKSLPELERLGHDLDQAIDLGWFWLIAKPLMWTLLMIHSLVGNYGWSIIILTIAIRGLFYPVNKRQIVAMKGMQRIQPEIAKIQERYKDDREKLNKEMMELYRRHKVNPLAGCLPMLVQLPVFVGLYNVLLQAIELRHAPFFGWINDLSQPDRLGHLAIPFMSPPGIPVLTLLMGASMIVQQKMTPSTADPTQQRMMLFMPIIFTVMFVNFPAGLVLYWFSNNLLSIGQQYLSNRQGR